MTNDECRHVDLASFVLRVVWKVAWFLRRGCEVREAVFSGEK